MLFLVQSEFSPGTYIFADDLIQALKTWKQFVASEKNIDVNSVTDAMMIQVVAKDEDIIGLHRLLSMKLKELNPSKAEIRES